MGFDFKTSGTDYYDDASWFRLNCDAWPNVYHLGIAFGWEPQGTDFGGTSYDVTEAELEEFAESWDGTYFLNEGQIVRESDAANLGAALRQALKFMPTARMEVREEDPEVAQALCRFSGQNREYLQGFITFVERAGFVIF